MSRKKWQEYEREKQRLISRGLPHKEYEHALRELARRYKL